MSIPAEGITNYDTIVMFTSHNSEAWICILLFHSQSTSVRHIHKSIRKPLSLRSFFVIRP